MNATTLDGSSKPSPRMVMWAGLALIVAQVIGMALLARMEPLTHERALVIVGLSVAGTLVMAWLMQRHSLYPRWAWWATAAVMVVALLVSLPIAGDPVAWEDDFRSSAWILTWFLYTMGITPAARRGVCAARPRTGWMMVGTGALLSVILLAAHPLVRWISGGSWGRFFVQ